jgi:hypothetical protein
MTEIYLNEAAKNVARMTKARATRATQANAVLGRVAEGGDRTQATAELAAIFKEDHGLNPLRGRGAMCALISDARDLGREESARERREKQQQKEAERLARAEAHQRRLDEAEAKRAAAAAAETGKKTGITVAFKPKNFDNKVETERKAAAAPPATAPPNRVMATKKSAAVTTWTAKRPIARLTPRPSAPSPPPRHVMKASVAVAANAVADTLVQELSWPALPQRSPPSHTTAPAPAPLPSPSLPRSEEPMAVVASPLPLPAVVDATNERWPTADYGDDADARIVLGPGTVFSPEPPTEGAKTPETTHVQVVATPLPEAPLVIPVAAAEPVASESLAPVEAVAPAATTVVMPPPYSEPEPTMPAPIAKVLQLEQELVAAHAVIRDQKDRIRRFEVRAKLDQKRESSALKALYAQFAHAAKELSAERSEFAPAFDELFLLVSEP